MSYAGNRPILLVEDSDVDYEALVRCFRKTDCANPIFRCADGDEALDYLRRRGRYGAAGGGSPPPGLILLDLKMPGVDGRQVLAELKQDDQLRSIPVVVLTTSAAERDVAACYRAGANSYIQKPLDFGEFLEAVRCLRRYWFDVALLPRVS